MLGQSGCRVVTGLSVRGYEALILENRRLQVWVLPEKGSDIVQFLYKPRDVDFTWSTVWGLPTNRGPRPFIDQYEGGWQEIFPNGGPPSVYQGVTLDQHDEVAGLLWQWEVVEQTASRVAVRLTVNLQKTPFRLEKCLILEADSGLMIRETATNLSSLPMEAMWGHHLAFGSPWLNETCRLETDAKTVLVTPEPIEPRRYRPGRYAWPWVDGEDGKLLDLRHIPARDQTRDIVYLTDFSQGYYRLSHSQQQLALKVTWDRRVLPYCWYWQELGAPGYPWYGRHYNIGLEPFSSYPTHGLAEAIANGSSRRFAGHEHLNLDLTIDVEE